MTRKIIVTDIKSNEIEQAATTLFHAFNTDPVMLWLFGDENNYQLHSKDVFATWIKYCILYGKAIRTIDFEAIALRKMPGDINMSLWRIYRSGIFNSEKLMGKHAFDRLVKLDDMLALEKQKCLGNRLYWYCWMLGTHPDFQKQGFGSALMKHTFELAEHDKLPCYLEVANPESARVHMHKGYKVLSEFLLPESDIKIFTMLRE